MLVSEDKVPRSFGAVHFSTVAQRITAKDILRHPWIKGLPPDTPLPLPGLLDTECAQRHPCPGTHPSQRIRGRPEQVRGDRQRQAPHRAVEHGAAFVHDTRGCELRPCSGAAPGLGRVAAAVHPHAGAAGPVGDPHAQVPLVRLRCGGGVCVHRQGRSATEPRRRDARVAVQQQLLGRRAVLHAVQVRQVEHCSGVRAAVRGGGAYGWGSWTRC